MAVDAAVRHVDEIGEAAVEVAANAHVARGQRAAREQCHVPADLGVRKLTAARDREIVADLDGARAPRGLRWLRVGGETLQAKTHRAVRAERTEAGHTHLPCDSR